jgi:invasion protein IalB
MEASPAPADDRRRIGRWVLTMVCDRRRLGYDFAMKCMRTTCLAALPAAVLLMLVPAARGQTPPGAGSPPAAGDDQPRKLEDYGDWRALVAGNGDARACYMTQKVLPVPAEGRAKERPLLYVTHRPAKNAFNVVAYFAGYAVKPDSDVELDFGFAKFRLFTQEGSNGAWSGSPEIDGRIVEAMRAGNTVTARGTEESGREVADTFSLQGVTAALFRITQECRPR